MPCVDGRESMSSQHLNAISMQYDLDKALKRNDELARFCCEAIRFIRSLEVPFNEYNFSGEFLRFYNEHILFDNQRKKEEIEQYKAKIAKLQSEIIDL